MSDPPLQSTWLGPKTDLAQFRLLAKDLVDVDTWRGRELLLVNPEALRLLAKVAFHDVSFLLRTAHLQKLGAILQDPAASQNDRFVAESLLQNAVIAARGVLPLCQDTGTATVLASKGEQVLTGGEDERFLTEGIAETWQTDHLRFSQLAARSLFDEVNTGTNLPAQIDISAVPGLEYHFLFMAKGGGSANKTALFQQSKALLQESVLDAFLRERVNALGVAACPPYHLAIVIGGSSPEANLKTVKLAAAGWLDELPSRGNDQGIPFRDPTWEARVLEMAQTSGWGAQFGGRHLALDVRVIRLPRHAGSCPVGIGLSCSADRHIRGLINRDGVFLEQLDRDPERFLAGAVGASTAQAVPIDLAVPMDNIRQALSRHPVGTRLALSGPLIVARDAAHARLNQRLEETGTLPDYFKRHPVYYAGPAKTPPRLPSGSFGPTTARRMDHYLGRFMQHRASLVTLAKGERSEAVTDLCKKFGGFYLGTIGGAAALVAEKCITRSELLDFPDLGMEAIRRIEVRNLPAFIICDDKGNQLYPQRAAPTGLAARSAAR